MMVKVYEGGDPRRLDTQTDPRKTLEKNSKSIVGYLCVNFVIAAAGGGISYLGKHIMSNADNAINERRAVTELPAKAESKKYFDQVIRPLLDSPSGFSIAKDPKATKDYYLELVSKCIGQQYKPEEASSIQIQQGQIVKPSLDIDRINLCVQSSHANTVNFKDDIVKTETLKSSGGNVVDIFGKIFMVAGGAAMFLNTVDYLSTRRRLRKMCVSSSQPRAEMV